MTTAPSDATTGPAQAGSDPAAAEVRVRLLRDGAQQPRRQSEQASGYDLHACAGEVITIGPLPVLVPTGVAIEAPAGTDVQIRPRSGLSRRGVMALLGTIDADYRGELFVTMYTLPGVDPFEVRTGDRIAQLVIAQLATVEWTLADELEPTERGTGGHGSTGTR